MLARKKERATPEATYFLFLLFVVATNTMGKLFRKEALSTSYLRVGTKNLSKSSS